MSRKRMFAFAFVIVSLLCLTGCGGEGSTEVSDSVSDNGQEPELSEESVSAQETEECRIVTYGEEALASVWEGELLLIASHCLVDLDMDGELDEVNLTVDAVDETDYFYDCCLTVNSQKCLAEMVLLEQDDENLPLYLLTPDGSRLMIALMARDHSYNEETYLYLYEDDALQQMQVWGLPKRYDAERGGLVVQTLESQLQWHRTDRIYLLFDGEEGYVFQRRPGYTDYTTVDYSTGEEKVFQVIKDLTGYTEYNVDAEKLLLEAGSQFTVTGGDGAEWLLVHVEGTDTDCWLHIGSGSVIEEDGTLVSVQEYVGNVDVVN